MPIFATSLYVIVGNTIHLKTLPSAIKLIDRNSFTIYLLHQFAINVILFIFAQTINNCTIWIVIISVFSFSFVIPLLIGLIFEILKTNYGFNKTTLYKIP